MSVCRIPAKNLRRISNSIVPFFPPKICVTNCQLPTDCNHWTSVSPQSPKVRMWCESANVLEHQTRDRNIAKKHKMRMCSSTKSISHGAWHVRTSHFLCGDTKCKSAKCEHGESARAHSHFRTNTHSHFWALRGHNIMAMAGGVPSIKYHYLSRDTTATS